MRHAVLGPVLRGLGTAMVVVACVSCTGSGEARSGGQPDTRPVAGPGGPPYLCGVLPKTSAVLVTGQDDLRDSGELRPGEVRVCNVKNADRVVITLDTGAGRSPAEVSSYVEDRVSHAPGGRRLPADIKGVGYVAFTDSRKRQAMVELFVGDQRLHLEIRRSPKGRDPQADAVALLRQVAPKLGFG